MIRPYHSVFFKLHAFFILAFSVLALLLVSALHNQDHQRLRLLIHRAMELSQTLEMVKDHNCHHQAQELHRVGFQAIASFDSSHAKRIHLPPMAERKLHANRLSVQIYQDNGGYIYLLIRDHCTMIYRDTVEGKKHYFTWILFFTLFGGVVTLYLLLWRNLRPLKDLYEQIQDYDAGKELITSPSSGHDEIALISNALHASLVRQNGLKKSRELFLRNIMHELKTPIMKGKLIVELQDPNPNTLLLGKLFSRMEHLIFQMAELEKMHAFSLEKTSFSLYHAIDTALKNLLLPPHSVALEGEKTILIYADENLFTSAIQNLIDNAHRHATTLPIRIEWNEEKMGIRNQGEPLKRPIQEALQAFVTQRGEGGLGLGLYIAQSVCELHHFTLSYRYEEGEHFFGIQWGD
ncbi:MAG: ArsS family sensor histidine kinase [Sulfuricurvum sp.]